MIPPDNPTGDLAYQMSRADEAIIRASHTDTTADSSCIFRLLSKPSKFFAPRPSSQTAGNREGFSVHKKEQRTKKTIHKLPDRFRPNRKIHTVITIPHNKVSYMTTQEHTKIDHNKEETERLDINDSISDVIDRGEQIRALVELRRG